MRIKPYRFIGLMSGRAIVRWALSLAAGVIAVQGARAEGFPSKPVTVVVYTAPGGMIDVTARKFAAIASKYTDAVMVVENLPGAGGLLAVKNVMRRPADGYTLLACTRSNIPNLVAARGEAYIDALHWVALLMVDPECVIVRRDAAIDAWEPLLADAMARPGEQLWLGPDQGGLDHVMAVKIWERAGITARWVPYSSGDKAMLALMGGQGLAYVGNPSDIVNLPDLVMAAVSSPTRLLQFPDVPTFGECGLDGLDDEVMWRGFALRRGAPAEALAWYDRLFRQVTEDPEWRAFWERSAIQPIYLGPDDFEAMVREDRAEFAHYLARMGMVTTASGGWRGWLAGPGGLWFYSLMLVGAWGLAWAAARRSGSPPLGALGVPLGLLATGVALAFLTLTFPEEEGSLSAVVPRLWAGALILAALAVLVMEWRQPARIPALAPRAAWGLLALTALYILLLPWGGYAPTTFVFLLAGMRALGYARPGVAVATALAWAAGSWWLFVRVLYVPLPAGQIWAALGMG